MRESSAAFEVMESLVWYHADISRHMAEALLIANGKEGSFLLRNIPEGLCLTVRSRNAVTHFKIEITRSGEVLFANTTFAGVDKLLQAIANNIILCGEAESLTENFEQGTLLTLKYPYPCKVEEPDIYDVTMTLHSTVHSSATIEDLNLQSQAVALASKCGFLKKEGGNIKSWKQRWIVILRNELSYYEDRASDRPIRTLNLNDCRRAGYSNIPGKTNCFYLEFPDRTWNFSANTSKEVEEWIAILQWKISQNKITGHGK